MNLTIIHFNNYSWPHFFLSDVSDSGGIPTRRTVPFSTSLGAAMMSGSSLQRLFLVLMTTMTTTTTREEKKKSHKDKERLSV